MSGEERRGGATGVRLTSDGVHRRTGSWTPHVHELLAHVRAHGVPEAPGVVRFDDDGDEVLTFIAGDAGVDPLDDGQLETIGDLVQRLRLAMASFPDAQDRPWRPPTGGGPALVHGDVAPWNLVWQQDQLVGLLDWDLAGLSTHGFDLAYAAWTCVPLAAGHDVEEQARRLRLLADAAGVDAPARAALVGEIAHAQIRVAYIVAHGGVSGQLGMPGIWSAGRWLARSIAPDVTWLGEHRDTLEAALG